MDEMPCHYLEGHHRSADGLALYYRDYGHRDHGAAVPAPTPVLCVPGLTRNCRDFDTLAQRLAMTRRVITTDLRGRGRSDRDPDWSHYQPPTYATDALGLIDALGLTRVVLVGTSLGGLVGMLIAATRPGRLAGLVLNDIGPEVAPEGVARIRSYVGQNATVRNWDEAVTQTRNSYGIAYPDFDDAQWQAFTRLGYREDADGVPRPDYDPEIRRAAQSAAAAPPLWPYFGMLAATPMLVLRGAHSDILAPTTLERMQAEHPRLRTATVAHRGHAPTLDEPDSTAAIEAFLAGLD